MSLDNIKLNPEVGFVHLRAIKKLLTSMIEGTFIKEEGEAFLVNGEEESKKLILEIEQEFAQALAKVSFNPLIREV